MSKFSYSFLVFTHSAILREHAEIGYSVDAVAPLKFFSFLSFQVDQRIEKGMGLQIIRSGFRTIERAMPSGIHHFTKGPSVAP